MKPVVACSQNGFPGGSELELKRWKDTGSERTLGVKSCLSDGRKR